MCFLAQFYDGRFSVRADLTVWSKTMARSQTKVGHAFIE